MKGVMDLMSMKNTDRRQIEGSKKLSAQRTEGG